LRHDSNKWASDSAGTVEALMSLLPVVSNSINATVGVPHLTRLLSDKAHHAKVAAVKALESSAQHASAPERAALAAAAAVPLVGLLQYGTAEMQAAASSTLGFIMPAQEDHRSLLEPLAAIPTLVQLLTCGADATAGAAAYALMRFSDNSPYYQRLVASEGAIQPLLQLLRNGSEGANRRTCWALAELASEPENQKELEAAGFIPHLLQAFATGSQQLRRRVADALVVAADQSANRPAIMCALPTLLRWEPAPTACEAYFAVRKTFAKMVNCSTCTGTTGANDVLAAAVQLLKNGNESDATVQMVTDALQHVAVDPTVRDRIVAAGAVHQLVTLLDRGIATPYAATTVGTLDLIARDSDKKLLVVQASAVPSLIKWIGAEVNASYASAKKSAQETVHRLVTPPTNATTTEGEEAAIAALVHLLGDKDDTTRTTVSSVVKTVAADPRVREMVVTAGGVPPLVRILLDNSDNCKMCVNAAVGALETLTTNAATKRLAVGAGVVEPLVHLIANGDSAAQIAAKMAIRKLMTLDENEVVVAAPDAAPALLRVLSNSTDTAKIEILRTIQDFAADTTLRAIFTAAGVKPILSELLTREGEVGSEAMFCIAIGRWLGSN
jgi:vacuolar protein 8